MLVGEIKIYLNFVENMKIKLKWIRGIHFEKGKQNFNFIFQMKSRKSERLMNRAQVEDFVLL